MKFFRELPPMELLRERLSYNPEDGVLRWKSDSPKFDLRQAGVSVGSIAGSINNDGYRHIKINQTKFSAHRIAWSLHHGKHPDGVVDHIDGNKTNNSASNLRLTDAFGNARNCKRFRTNKIGFKGVMFRDKKFVSQIRNRGTPQILGYFDSAEEAHEVYCLAADMLFGEFANHG